MNRFLMSVAAGFLTLAAVPATQAMARPPVEHHGESRHVERGHRDYHAEHGHAYYREGHRYYPGRDYHFWAHHAWNPRYGCEVYFDPGLNCDFYFCVPDNCYYPVTYCPYGRYCW